ncbi:uncharacterized protein LOC130795743 [Actinidia eriantha]|uniref:uncharacterized protein LOC130795743 n=1 Tax=Actinidia eriantha TaxID=165200 RepID=UPI00258A4F65|nr:uncharacterized protein LOC130795743 [Actinidia eriantha]
MSSILNSQGVVLATAMAVSGIIILLALRLQRSFPEAQFQPPPPLPRSCISSGPNSKIFNLQWTKVRKESNCGGQRDTCQSQVAGIGVGIGKVGTADLGPLKTGPSAPTLHAFLLVPCGHHPE